MSGFMYGKLTSASGRSIQVALLTTGQELLVKPTYYRVAVDHCPAWVEVVAYCGGAEERRTAFVSEGTSHDRSITFP